MKINEINKYELCKLAYRVKEKLLPKALLEMFDAQGKKNAQILDKKQELTKHNETC